jgi:hypothetical protein
LIDAKFLSAPHGSILTIENNLFYHNEADPVGIGIRTGDPRFFDPLRFDFRIHKDSPAVQEGPDIGAYDAENAVHPGTEWWKIREGQWASRFLQPGTHTVH